MFKQLVVTLVVFAFAREARAECVSMGLCMNFTYANTVFLADVMDVQGPDVTFNVLEGFKNVRRGLKTYRIAQSLESPQFKGGDRVLAYLWRRSDGSLETSVCHTRRVETHDSEISAVRHLARRDAGATVSGGLWRPDGDWNRRPDARITLRPVSGQGPTLVTTSLGWGFKFDWVSPGLYVVAFEGDERYLPQRRLIRIGDGQKCFSGAGFRIQER